MGGIGGDGSAQQLCSGALLQLVLTPPSPAGSQAEQEEVESIVTKYSHYNPVGDCLHLIGALLFQPPLCFSLLQICMGSHVGCS